MLRSKIIVFYSFIAKRIAKLLWLNVNCIVWLVNFYCILLLFLDEYSAAGSTVCTQCPAGYTCSGGTATQCNAGQYSPAGGKTELNVTLVVMPEDKIKQQNLVHVYLQLPVGFYQKKVMCIFQWIQICLPFVRVNKFTQYILIFSFVKVVQMKQSKIFLQIKNWFKYNSKEWVHALFVLYECTMAMSEN